MRYAIVAMLCSGALVFAQQQPSSNAPSSAPNSPSAQPNENCTWGAAKGSKGPWKSSSTCPSSQSPTDQGATPLTPDKSATGQQKQQTPQDANPFPEDVSRKAQDAADSADPNSKSAEPDYSSSHVDLKKFDAPEGSDSRISNGAGGFIHDPELAARDDKVAKFYLQNGDFKGAYDRYKEATEVAPEDGEAVFGLAESARGLHRTQEAAANYQIYLSAFPDGKKSKDARKALATLTAPQKK